VIIWTVFTLIAFTSTITGGIGAKSGILQEITREFSAYIDKQICGMPLMTTIFEQSCMNYDLEFWKIMGVNFDKIAKK
jgi:hypothetical protein